MIWREKKRAQGIKVHLKVLDFANLSKPEWAQRSEFDSDFRAAILKKNALGNQKKVGRFLCFILISLSDFAYKRPIKCTVYSSHSTVVTSVWKKSIYLLHEKIGQKIKNSLQN